jgi:hypothetical protein
MAKTKSELRLANIRKAFDVARHGWTPRDEEGKIEALAATACGRCSVEYFELGVYYQCSYYAHRAAKIEADHTGVVQYWLPFLEMTTKECEAAKEEEAELRKSRKNKEAE